MRIAVAGGTGTVGRHVVEVARARAHEVAVLTRREGVDVATGAGLDAALDGVDAVVDVLNVSATSAAEVSAFFQAATGNLLAAAARAGVGNSVVLSIVGIDRQPDGGGYGYYAGKVAQERAVEASRAPWTILRATQFHEFAQLMYARATIGPVHVAPKARVQPVAAREVAERLVDLAVGPALGRARDLAGPREEDLARMVQRYATATGHRAPVALALPGALGRLMRSGAMLPDADADLATQTFAEWVAEWDAGQT